MAKRKPLVAPDALSDELKKSTGQGLGAFFAPSPPAKSQPTPEDEALPEATAQTPARKPRSKQANVLEDTQTSKEVSNITSNITILHFTGADIEELKEPAYKAQTFRLAERNIEWIRDVSHQLSKEFRRGKVSQTDLLRISLKLLENTLATNKAEVLKILEAIK